MKINGSPEELVESGGGQLASQLPFPIMCLKAALEARPFLGNSQREQGTQAMGTYRVSPRCEGDGLHVVVRDDLSRTRNEMRRQYPAHSSENQPFAGRRENRQGVVKMGQAVSHEHDSDRSRQQPTCTGLFPAHQLLSAQPAPCHVGLTAALGGGRWGAHFTDRDPEAQGQQRALGSTVTTHRGSPTRKASHPHAERQPQCRVCIQRHVACRTDPQ